MKPLFAWGALLLFLAGGASSAATVQEAWVQRFNGEQKSADEAYKVACDAQGNVIVAGYTDDSIYGGDILVIKYTSGGIPLWTNRYNSPTSEEDRPRALAVDTLGNVFVAGLSVSNSYLDCVTLAYSSSGAPLWTNTYCAPGDNSAQAIAVSQDGTVFVVGTGPGYVTIAYSNTGTPLWTNVYRFDNWATPTAMAVGANGHVIITGVHGTYSGSQDFATIALSGEGTLLWTNRFRGPGGYYHVPKAVAVDGQGNVFVTGASDNEGLSGSSAYATIAYSAAGVPLWTNRYDRAEEGLTGSASPVALAVDIGGNIFVTGSAPLPKPPGPGASPKTYCYATVAYSGTGLPLWTNLYAGTGSNASPVAIAVDRGGDVLVTGAAAALEYGAPGYATVKYSASGESMWTNTYPGSGSTYYLPGGLALNANGEAFVTGYSFDLLSYARNWLTLAYSSVGTALWTNRYDGPANAADSTSAVATDGEGNVYVTGSSFEGPAPSYTTLKYSAAGERLWLRRYSDPFKNYALARALVVAPSGDVIVTGQCQVTNSCYGTIAYSQSGLPLWTNLYDAGYGSSPVALVVDAAGTIFVSGSSFAVSGGYSSQDFLTVAYSADGLPLWTNRFGNPQYADSVAALALDSAGNVIVTGSVMAQNGRSDFATVSYSGAGVPLWTNFYNGPNNDDDYSKALATDRAGNVVVTGTSLPGSVTIKYSAGGAPLWTNRFNGTAAAVGIDPGGNVAVTGYVYQDGRYVYATAVYSSAGLPLWTNLFAIPDVLDNRAVATAVDDGGNVFVTGSSGLNGGDIVTLAYSAAGLPLWTNSYNGPANGRDKPPNSKCLALTGDGGLVVAGSSSGSYSGTVVNDYVLVKYAMLPTIVAGAKEGPAFQLSFSGMPGRTYITQFTTNLVSGPWMNLGTNTADPLGLWSLTDSFASDPHRLYRIKSINR